MNNKVVDINFHETFPPTLRYISEIVKLASCNYCGTKEDISSMTGIPTGENSGKVVPHIKYAKYMNLINYSIIDKGKYKLELTDLGEIIYKEDRFFIEKISKLIINYFLCDYKDGAPHWSFIFNRYRYSLDTEYSLKHIEDEARANFGKNVKMTVFKNMYVGEYGFKELHLIDELENKNIIFNRNYMNYEQLYVYGYTMLYSWEKYFKDKIEINIYDIIDNMRWSSKFGFDYNTTLEVLDELQDLGLIKLNKQLTPITIVKISNSKDIMENMYDLAL